MSLTQDIANMVQAANSLTQEVSEKLNKIDQRVDDATLEIFTKIQQQFDTVLYISSNGDDSNTGYSSEAPLQTFNAAFDGRTPSGARVKIELLSDMLLDERATFVNKHIFIETNGYTITLGATEKKDTSYTVVGTGIGRIQGAGQNASLVIHDGKIITGDCISSGNGQQWYWHLSRTAIQLGGVDFNSGFFPVVINGTEIILGKNVIGLSSGDAGASYYAGQGVICLTLYQGTVDASAEGASVYGKGIHVRNNVFGDVDGKPFQVA